MYLSGDTLVYHGWLAYIDPLTGAVLTLKEIRDMTNEMLEELRPYLPQFEGKSLRPAPTIVIPPDVRAVDTGM